MRLAVIPQAPELDVFCATVLAAFLAFFFRQAVLNVCVLITSIDAETESRLLCASKLLVTTDCVIFQSNRKIPDQRTESLIEEDLVPNGQDKDHNHADTLTAACHLAILIFNQEEQSNQTRLHDVQPSEELIDRTRKKKTASVETELGDVEGIVSIDKPEETEGDDVEDEDERCDDAVNQTYFVLEDARFKNISSLTIPIEARTV